MNLLNTDPPIKPGDQTGQPGGDGQEPCPGADTSEASDKSEDSDPAAD